MNDEFPIYKIKYVLRPNWKLREAAHLLVGFDPINDTQPIKRHEPNPVSVTLYWLKRQRSNGRLFATAVTELGRKISTDPSKVPFRSTLYEPRQFFELKNPPVDFDREINQLFFDQRSAHVQAKLRRTITRFDGKMVWEKHASATKDSIAYALESLPVELGRRTSIALHHHSHSVLMDDLKGIGDRGTGAPTKFENHQLKISIGQIIDELIKII